MLGDITNVETTLQGVPRFGGSSASPNNFNGKENVMQSCITKLNDYSNIPTLNLPMSYMQESTYKASSRLFSITSNICEIY